jgi:hypothetical protein
MSKRIDISGIRYGRLVVSQYHGMRLQRPHWECICDCGKITVVYGQHLKNGMTKSCGCYHRDQTSLAKREHGRSRSKIHWIWVAMKQRCSNPANKGYPDYGGRGITVCQRWMKFENFLSDMGDRPNGYSLDRIDNNKGYSKENCRWASVQLQSRNKRSSKLITFNNETLSESEWARKLGLSRGCVIARRKKGMTAEQALTTPIRYQSKLIKP